MFLDAQWVKLPGLMSFLIVTRLGCAPTVPDEGEDPLLDRALLGLQPRIAVNSSLFAWGRGKVDPNGEFTRCLGWNRAVNIFTVHFR